MLGQAVLVERPDDHAQAQQRLEKLASRDGRAREDEVGRRVSDSEAEVAEAPAEAEEG